ncbi:uncharacterized protein LOC124382965 isoform X1 [Silurus meridionalis]|uniref:uncharacterized protein LOC124382965 isoform X1 n=2 Tax=Silurus meridionalis TaxID=175797 RepID=UPI001EECB903|nr:uncharacterized protein LOC124382965 isoform X1 [Silurus meridionalis]
MSTFVLSVLFVHSFSFVSFIFYQFIEILFIFQSNCQSNCSCYPFFFQVCSLQLEMEEMTAQSPHQQHTNEDAGLWDFLRKRGVPEENIDQMQQDRIDTSVVRELDDTCLARYIPLYGDRIATRQYCLDKQKRKDDSCSKMSLLEKLRKKMSTATTSHEEETTEERRPTKKASYKRNATKSSRKIELGWIHEGKQVRKRCGRGTRILDISKDATKNDLMAHAKELFFPHGESKKGKWEEFTHSIYDFKESELEDSITLGELYTLSKFGILRFYLHTMWHKDKSGTEVDNEKDRHSGPLGEQQKRAQRINSDQHLEKPLCVHKPQTNPSCTVKECNHATSSAHLAVVGVINLTSLSYDSKVIVGGIEDVSSASQLDDTVPVVACTEEVINVGLSTSTPVKHTVCSSGNADYELLLMKKAMMQMVCQGMSMLHFGQNF